MSSIAIGLVAGVLTAAGSSCASGEDDSSARRQGALESSVQGSPPTGPAGGHLTGEYPEPKIAPDVIGSGQIATGAVNSGEIADGAVGAAEIGANAVNGPRITDGSVNFSDLADDAVRSSDVLDGAIGTPDLAAQGVNAGVLAAVTLRESDWTEIPDSVGTHKVSATVSCSSGEQLLSAGGRWRYPAFGNTFDRGQLVAQSTVTAYGSSDDTPNALRAWALCLSA